MSAKRIRVALGAVAVVIAGATVLCRLTEEQRTAGVGRDPLSPESLCLGIEHPETGRGLVSVTGRDAVVAAAVEQLGLPDACLGASLPADLANS